MTLTRESIVLISLCMIDLAATLILIGSDLASEGNPLMAFYLHYGVGTFVLIKLTLIFLPIFVAEWYMQFKPDFVRAVMRATIVGYVGIYALLFLIVNVRGSMDSYYIPPQPISYQTQQSNQ